jgi:drug/metabolite transporter (DMT)-like permease
MARKAIFLRDNPLAKGSLLALAAAAAFGATTPLIQRSGRGVGPFTTAALLYVGASLYALRPRSSADSPLRSRDAGRLLVVALLGAVVAPVSLAWGLARTSGVTASLLLNTEAPCTVLFARVLWGERIGARVGLALLAMGCAGALLVAQGGATSADTAWGAVAALGAALAWAADSVIGRPLADRDPNQVVFAKASIGALSSLGLARAFGEGWPTPGTGLALATCGAVGYGASLGLYLRAQRLVGAARTGSIFAAAPFLGASLAWAIGERSGGYTTIIAGGLCALGVGLHLTEGHAHEHIHDPATHEHAHRHDDGHHDHEHGDSERPEGATHSHAHEHGRVSHAHAHGPDLHHRHRH